MAEAQPPNPVNLDAIIRASQIPDTIKYLPVFRGDSGNPRELYGFLNTVERTLTLYQNLVQEPIYNVWITYIYNKVQGPAKEQLEVSHTPIVWAKIRQKLLDLYGDNRDLSSFTQKIPYLKQGNKTVEQFYTECSNLLADINAKITLDINNLGHEQAIMRVINRMTTDAFIDGLNQPYSSFTRNANPADLPSAYRLALHQTLGERRKGERINLNRPVSSNLPQGRSFQNPPRPSNLPRSNNFPTFPRTNYFPNSPQANIATPPRNFPNYPRFYPQNPTLPPRQPRPVPMEVDRSIRSNQIQYMNRNAPRNPQINRNPPPNVQHSNRFQQQMRNPTPQIQIEELTNMDQDLEYDPYDYQDLSYDSYDYPQDYSYEQYYPDHADLPANTVEIPKENSKENVQTPQNPGELNFHLEIASKGID
jgi:hypothetical protein